ncbi:MAG: hypothetical protein JST68_02500 [Bacteroidetes bacterium]|nr:hypothetical protein [Bacteroidota bacterium]
MQPKRPSLPYYYLTIVPFLAAAIGFGIGRSPSFIHIPIWIIHTILMVILLRKIGNPSPAAVFLVIPWILFPLFAGFGPPPSTAEHWVNLAAEEQIRYSILVIGGICAAIGWFLLKQQLRPSPYSTAATALLFIAMPLFILNMLYWGFFLTASFKNFVAKGQTERPDWYVMIRELFFWIGSIETSLLYAVSGLFALAIKTSGIFKPRPCNIYIGFSLFGLTCGLLPANIPAPLDVIGYITAVPAIPFIMPYLIGVNLIRSKNASI